MEYLDLTSCVNDTLKIIEFDSYKSAFKNNDKKICENIKKMSDYISDNYKNEQYYQWLLAIVVVSFYLYLRSFILLRKDRNSYFMSMLESVAGRQDFKDITEGMYSKFNTKDILKLLEICSGLGPLPFSSWNKSLSNLAKIMHRHSLKCSKYISFVLDNNENKKKWNSIEISTIYKKDENLKFLDQKLNEEVTNQINKFNIPHILPIDKFYDNLFSCFVNIALRKDTDYKTYIAENSEWINLNKKVEGYQQYRNKLDKFVEKIDMRNEKELLRHLNDLRVIDDFQKITKNISEII